MGSIYFSDLVYAYNLITLGEADINVNKVKDEFVFIQEALYFAQILNVFDICSKTTFST